MKKGGIGGGNTKTGIFFEKETDLASLLNKQPGYNVKDDDEYPSKSLRSHAYKVFYKEKLVARIFKQNTFYKMLEKELGIDWKKILSKRLLPDDSIYVISNNTLFIIECKHQEGSGSVDEKLQTCDFKKKEYQKLMSRANIEVEYMYVLDKWFEERQDTYKDVLDYIISVGCRFYFSYIPLKELGLPVPESEENAQ